MAELFNIHMASDLTEWTSTTTDSGDLSQAAGAGLGGTTGGMQLVVDDTNVIYGVKTVTTNTSGTLRARFYIDPNGLTMANSDVFTVAHFRSTDFAQLYVNLKYITGTGYVINTRTWLDSGSLDSSDYAITDAEHYIEIELVRASGESTNDGITRLWIDGVAKTNVTNIDNYTRFANFATLRIGAEQNIDAGTSGTFYIDEIAANDDGSEIGPVSTGITGTLNVTLAAATVTAAGKVAVDGDANITLANASVNATGAVQVQGTAAINLAAATLAAEGTVTDLTPATGTLDVTLAAATLTATGAVAVSGTAAITLQDASLSAAGAVAVAGALDQTLADATLSAAGTVTDIQSIGTLIVTLANATVGASGTVAIAGAGNITLADATASGIGKVAIYGNATIALAAAMLVATGLVQVQGTGPGGRKVHYVRSRANLEQASRATLYVNERETVEI